MSRTQVLSDIDTAKNFARRAREELQENKPVMAYTMLQKVDEYLDKAYKGLKL